MASSSHRLIVSSDEIAARVAELGVIISVDYQKQKADLHNKPLIVLCVLDSAYMFTADLSRALSIPHEIHFIKATRTKSQTDPDHFTTTLTILDLQQRAEWQSRDILVVEDIIDTGTTWQALRCELYTRNATAPPKSLKLCSLLQRTYNEANVTVDYLGFPLTTDAHIFGYGMDKEGQFRGLPYLVTCYGNSNCKEEQA